MKQISFPKSFSYPASKRVPSRILTTEIGQPFLYFMFSRSFTPLWMTKKTSEAKKGNITPQRAKRCYEKAQRSGLTFLPWSEGAFRSVKNKKLFERSEFFLFSREKCRSRQKSADGEFLCFVSLFVQRNEEPSRLEREQSDKAQRRLSEKGKRNEKPLRQLSKSPSGDWAKITLV